MATQPAAPRSLRHGEGRLRSIGTNSNRLARLATIARASMSRARRIVPPRAMTYGLLLVLAAGCAFEAGRAFRLGEVSTAHASGACIALELAAAHDFLDTTAKHLILRSLTSALNPHFDRFPERSADVRRACESLTNGASAGKAGSRIAR